MTELIKGTETHQQPASQQAQTGPGVEHLFSICRKLLRCLPVEQHRRIVGSSRQPATKRFRRPERVSPSRISPDVHSPVRVPFSRSPEPFDSQRMILVYHISTVIETRTRE